MKKIEYSCNLCNEIKSSKDLFSFYYSSAREPKECVLSLNVDVGDIHICKRCISVIKDSAVTAPF